MHAPKVASLIRTFDDPSDGAAVKSLELILMLLERSPDPFSRAQVKPGHITCTGLVLATDEKAGQPGDDGPAGSVVLALDENKAKSAGRAIAEGAVTRLGCDPSLAEALDKYF